MKKTKKVVFDALQYINFLFKTQTNYTQTYFGQYSENYSHDTLNRWMRTTKLKSKDFKKEALENIIQSENGFLIFDDTVINKKHSHKIEMVQKQYSGNEGGLVKGIGVVNCVYVNPDLNFYWIIDYRIFSKKNDNKTKIDHVIEMFDAMKLLNISFKGVLIDSWYSSSKILNHIAKNNKFFYCPLKSNRKVKRAETEESYLSCAKIEMSENEVNFGLNCKLKNMSNDIKMKMLRVARSTTRKEMVVTNDPSIQSACVLEYNIALRWKIEQFHREIKQNFGFEACQCRKQRAQRNHINLCMLAWLKITKIARNLNQNIYEYKKSFLDEYMKHQINNTNLFFT